MPISLYRSYKLGLSSYLVVSVVLERNGTGSSSCVRQLSSEPPLPSPFVHYYVRKDPPPFSVDMVATQTQFSSHQVELSTGSTKVDVHI